MSLLQSIHSGKRSKPPRLLVYGSEGIGKSTLAAQAPKPIFVPTEDGLDQIACDSFPLAKTFPDAMNCFNVLASEKHDYRTVVLDSGDWLERLIWDHVCKLFGVTSIERVDGGYGKGYSHALTYWRQLIDVLRRLREEKGMISIILAHAKVESFTDPESSAFDPDLQIREKINDETIAHYAEQMATEEEMKKFPPVEIYYDGVKYWLADGHHRRAAAEKAGHMKIWAIIKSGTRADALWGAVLGNGKQGFGLTPDDRKRAIMLVIKQWPDKSNRVIAEAIGCSHTTVQRYRPTTETNVPVEDERRTGKDGKSRPAKQKAKTQEPPQCQPEDVEPPTEATSESTEQSSEQTPQFRPGSLPTKKYVGETKIPVVCHRQNHKPWVVVLRLDDLPRLSHIISRIDHERHDDQGYLADSDHLRCGNASAGPDGHQDLPSVH